MLSVGPEHLADVVAAAVFLHEAFAFLVDENNLRVPFTSRAGYLVKSPSLVLPR